MLGYGHLIFAFLQCRLCPPRFGEITNYANDAVDARRSLNWQIVSRYVAFPKFRKIDCCLVSNSLATESAIEILFDDALKQLHAYDAFDEPTDYPFSR